MDAAVADDIAVATQLKQVVSRLRKRELAEPKPEVKDRQRVREGYFNALAVDLLVRGQADHLQVQDDVAVSVRQRRKDIKVLRDRRESATRHAGENTDECRLVGALLEDHLIA